MKWYNLNDKTPVKDVPVIVKLRTGQYLTGNFEEDGDTLIFVDVLRIAWRRFIDVDKFAYLKEEPPEEIINIHRRGHNIRVVKEVSDDYSCYVNGNRFQKELDGDAVIRWLGNMMEDGSGG